MDQQQTLAENTTAKQLMQELEALEKDPMEKQRHLSVINEAFLKPGAEEAKLLLAGEIAHKLDLKNQLLDVEEIEKLAKNICKLVRATHKSVIAILEALRKILRDPRISPKTCLHCLIEVLTRTARSPFHINKSVEELCKRTVQVLPHELRMKLFSLNIGIIKRSNRSEVHCVLLAELLKYVPPNDLNNSIPALLAYIFHGFCSNVSSVQRSYIYKVIVERMDFPEWQERVFELSVKNFKQLHSNECFMESIKSYFIPMSAGKHRENFYTACRSADNVTICASSLLWLTKRGLCDPRVYHHDITYFCEHNSVASLGFDLLCCLPNTTSQILRFLYGYRWLEDKEKIAAILKRILKESLDEQLFEGVFYFSLVAINSTSRTVAEFGRELFNMVYKNRKCDENRYLNMLVGVYLKNSAISPSFIYDLYGFHKKELVAILKKIEDFNYQSSTNICYLTKASCIFHVYIKDEECDLNSFMLCVHQKLNDIGTHSFQNGSTLFYVKTLRFLYEDEIIDDNHQTTFNTLSTTITTLLSNTINELTTTSTRKLYESLLSDILGCMYSLLLHHKQETYQTQFLHSCFLTIQQSNFKQPVTTASSIFQKACAFGPTEILIPLIQKCFDGLNATNTSVSTIRCSAEYRLVLESICVARPTMTEEVFCQLLVVLRDEGASGCSVEAALHTVDALLSNKALQKVTRSYVEEVVGVILEKDWMGCFRTRNAVIQVWRTAVNLFKGASLEKIFLEYNRLPYIFYAALVKNGSVTANEKSLLILSVFIECAQSIYVLKPTLEEILNPFTTLFVHLILNGTGFCGRFAAAAYAAQCSPDAITYVLHDVAAFLVLRGNFYRIAALTNIVCLVRALAEKYLVYFEADDRFYDIVYVCLHSLRKINESLPYERVYFPQLVKSSDNRLRLYENSAKLNVSLEETLNNDLPVGLHIYLLSGVRNKTKFSFDTLTSLIVKAINLQTKCQYLLLSYVQTILFLYEKNHGNYKEQKFGLFKNVDAASQYTLYHFAIFSLVFAHGSDLPKKIQRKILQNLFEQYRSILNNEDPENLSLFASTLPYVYKSARTGRQRLVVFKLAVIFMASGDADEEFCKFVAGINNYKLNNFMCSVKMLLRYDNLIRHLRCADLVFEFLVDTSVYISRMRCENETSFYSVDTESHSLAVSDVKQMLFNCFKDFYVNKGKR